MPRHRFKFGEVFPPDDVLAEWVVTLALAFNDLSLVRGPRWDQESKHRWLYLFRLGIAHFREAAKYLRETTKIPAIGEFIDSLPDEVREHHRKCLECYDKHEEAIERVRHEAGFHYPELEIREGHRRKRTMQLVLDALRGNCGEIVGETIGDAELLFADDVASALVGRALSGELKPGRVEDLETLAQVSIEIEEGIGAFVQFAVGVLQRYLRLAIERGAEVRKLPE
jgi:hypothetical protein